MMAIFTLDTGHEDNSAYTRWGRPIKIGLVGGDDAQRSLPFDAQRTINLFPVLDQQGKEVAALYGSPGLVLFATAGSAPVRGEFSSTNGRAFAVAGATLYEVLPNGATVALGTLATASGAVTMDENPSQLAICDGASFYILIYATNIFTQVSQMAWSTAGTVTFIQTYFIVSQPGSGKFFISGNNDGLSWGALDFATAQDSPDVLVRAIRAVSLLWLFCTRHIELWQGTGALSFPFAKVAGANISVGCLAPHTIVAVDNSVFWVGQDRDGNGVVYRAQGFIPSRISNNAIELQLQNATDPTNLRAYTYQEEGHPFYCITAGGMSTTLVYDISTQLWHEKALMKNGVFEQHLATCHMYAFGKHLVGSKNDGSIYQQAQGIYSDAGAPLVSERTYTHISNENARTVFRQLEIAMESGVGLQSGQGSDPQITLWVSRDGARTWSSAYLASFGKVGQYLQRAVFRRLGYAMNITFRIRISDPVKRALIGSYLK